MDAAQETFEDYYDYPDQGERFSDPDPDPGNSDDPLIDDRYYGHPTYDSTRHFILFHFKPHINTPCSA
jgi:hypothetical protein